MKKPKLYKVRIQEDMEIFEYLKVSDKSETDLVQEIWDNDSYGLIGVSAKEISEIDGYVIKLEKKNSTNSDSGYNDKLNKIVLSFSNETTRLSGKSFGEEVYISQIKNKIDYSKLNTLVFSKSIEDISISFIQGLTEHIFKEIERDEFQNYFTIEGNSNIVDKAIKSIYY